ncbi:PREDICTED: leucine carboxyl methyltransferase 1-like [Priapulus caudatus]|uniref:Leucine carboxyl methyltransferase 1 n=1 Tax=Priapulus caudatus TaxID=37621 RepID=A0ABM1DUW7_PRICU|nr:PREDICTED: leucine carboxyl methyltransferase 1-like [Priapulus caudatus]
MTMQLCANVGPFSRLLKDEYIKYFCHTCERRAPEISRGYYARVMGVKHLLQQFIQMTGGACQIISLGAGYDTLYWRLCDERTTITRFVEVDFSDVTSKKCYVIKKRKQLLQKINSEDDDILLSRTDLHSSIYHLVAADLRNLKEFDSKLVESQIDKSLPTLFIAECVLVYMETNLSAQLLQWISDNFKTSFFINYEQVNMADTFGTVMLRNLMGRGCELLGVDACRSLETQKQRFLLTGWNGAESLEMMQVYKRLPQADIQRIQKLEFMDDVEVISQLFQHYAITWAFKDAANIGLQGIAV